VEVSAFLFKRLRGKVTEKDLRSEDSTTAKDGGISDQFAIAPKFWMKETLLVVVDDG